MTGFGGVDIDAILPAAGGLVEVRAVGEVEECGLCGVRESATVLRVHGGSRSLYLQICELLSKWQTRFSHLRSGS